MSANESKLAASKSPLRMKKDNHILTIIALMLLVCIIMLILKPGSYFTVLNVRSMIFQFPEYGVLALGAVPDGRWRGDLPSRGAAQGVCPCGRRRGPFRARL